MSGTPPSAHPPENTPLIVTLPHPTLAATIHSICTRTTFHPSSFTFYPAPLNLSFSSFTLHSSPFTLYPTSFSLYPSSFPPHLSPLIFYPHPLPFALQIPFNCLCACARANTADRPSPPPTSHHRHCSPHQSCYRRGEGCKQAPSRPVIDVYTQTHTSISI